MAIINMIRKRLSEPFGDEKGIVLAAVLIFISLILPVTLIILNTIEIETMLPTNEGYTKIALNEADKGFDIAMAALLEDNQDGFYGDYIVDPTRHVPLQFPLMILPVDTYYVPGMARGRHDIDYLAESWSRHPDNFTYFMAEHSRENETDPLFNPVPPGNPDEYSVPTRWILMNVPFGMDDHGERTFNDDYNTLSDILLPMDTFTGAGQVTPINAYPADTDDIDNEGQAPPVYVTENWIFSSSHPDYIKPNYIARPASYFRNTNVTDAAGSVVYNHEIEDALVYDGRLDDIDDDGAWGEDDKNQYLNNPVLQEAVLNSEWSNLHFGPGNLTKKNKEYKPLPGSVTQYPVGSSGDDYLPAWFQSIVSDESARFNLNTVLNIIYQGANYDYNSEGTAREVPLVRYDDYGVTMGDWEAMKTDEDHPNYSNYLIARDMVTALLLEDRELTSLVRFETAQKKADWILRNMLTVRGKLDLNYDADSDGEADLIDITYPDPNITPPTDPRPMNGRGRIGDAARPNQGTWRIYNNPKDFLNDPGRHNYADFPEYTPLAMEDFETLNRTCTVYTYDTEHTADAETSSPFSDNQDYRINFNECNEDDYFVNMMFTRFIGIERTKSLFRWRDGLVDLNADGDLNDEYILQPVKDPITAEAETNMTADSQPVSQITYRERNHFNFQEPANPAYPAMLNIPDLGTLAMVPMSVRDTQIIASIDGAGLSTFVPTNPGGPGDPIPNTDDGLSCDIDSSGTMLMFDTLNTLENLYDVDIPRGDVLTQMNDAEGYHPSYNPDGTQFVYVDKDTGMGDQTLSVYDIPSDSRVSTNWNGNVPLAIMNIPLGPGGDFFEAPSPDWSPIANTIAFAGGGELDFAGDPLTEHTDIYMVRLDGPTAGIPDNITNLPDGFFALYPDFSPDGEWIAYTLINFHDLFTGNAFLIVIQNLVDNRREVVLARPDLFMLAPDWDPSGNRLCFMGVPIFGGSTDIWTVSRGGTNLTNLTTSPENELFPSWGWGMTLVATQGDNDPGGALGKRVIYPALGINPDDEPWDETYREQLAQVIQEASLAFREDLDAGDEQNWRFMDLPVMPQHMVDQMQMCADVLSFRPSYTPVLAGEDPFTFIPQAYPGKVNINTAPRSVLRALFLLMFQGAVYQDSDSNNHGSAPMIESTISMRPTPINLGYDRTSNVERLYALAIADTYAHQVDEYRRWVYNNRSKSFNSPCYDNGSHSFSITRETVPDNLIFPVAGGITGKNYRANPFAPYDLDDDPFTKDRPLYDPEPPFRNIADLFNVALYNGELPVNWLLEGYDNDYGPDPEETANGRNVVPTSCNEQVEPVDEADFGDVYVGPNALAVWGPIYQTEYPVTFGLLGIDPDQILSPYEPGDSAVAKNPDSTFYKQQRFRLFSADDFKWISPYITTRSYVYRVESRGTVRVANGTSKLDVSRDKLWIVDFGAENYLSYETTGWETDNAEIIDQRVLMNNSSNQPYAIKAFEEVPVDGVRLTRGSFTPPKT